MVASTSSALDRVRGWLIDMDGVLYHDTEPIPGARELLAAFADQGVPHLLLTNNSSLTPEEYSTKLAGMGISVPPERILTSALATAERLSKDLGEVQPVYALGGSGLQVALAQQGLKVTTAYLQARSVVVGLDRELTYQKLTEATLAIRNGAVFVATNGDLTLPTPLGEIPGNGSIVAALEAATSRQPLMIGKPEPSIFAWACRRLGLAPEETACLGDRLETDILGGTRAGLVTVMVLCGISTRVDAETYEAPPDLILPGPADVLSAWNARRP